MREGEKENLREKESIQEEKEMKGKKIQNCKL